MDQKGRSVGPLGGRPTYWSADQAHGPTASTLPRGAPSLAPNVGSTEKSCDLGVAPSYKYKVRGRGMNTHTSHPLNSPFSLGA